jgi:DNA-binding response OmpR family regulator
MSTAILLAEPESATRTYLERQLADDGFEVVSAARTGEALDAAERERPALVLAGALDVCSRIRSGEPGRRWDRHVPVIVLAAAQADPVDRVRAFERGADDVVGRPIMYTELVARMRALLRRSHAVEEEVIDAGTVVVDRRTRTVRVHGWPVRLAGKEDELVARLAVDPRRVWTKAELLRDVWGYRGNVRTRTLDSHASRLRRKLAAVAPADDLVLNVWGVGYRLMQ